MEQERHTVSIDRASILFSSVAGPSSSQLQNLHRTLQALLTSGPTSVAMHLAVSALGSAIIPELGLLVVLLTFTCSDYHIGIKW